MTLFGHSDARATGEQRHLPYGWVVVAASCLLLVVHTGILQSFGVFFKPMIADFGWSRAATSGVYSIGLIVQGVMAIPTGWAADRFGPSKVMVFCGLVAGLGLVLSSQVSTLWQFYLTRGLVVGIGLSGSFSIATATTAGWFTKRRGVALGIVSSGAGLGTLFIVPSAERLVAAFGWANAFLMLGVFAWVAMLGGAVLLRRNQAGVERQPSRSDVPQQEPHGVSARTRGDSNTGGFSLGSAARIRPLLMLFTACFLFSLCVQMIVVHLVNYATDLSITPLVAATFMSVVGISSVCGRLAMGAISDRIGSINALAICCAVLIAAMPWLILARTPWTFYVFAVIFGFAHGGEVPQIPTLVAQFCGLKALSALVGTIVLGICIGGALGSWIAGQVFDLSGGYLLAFVVATVAGACALMTTLWLKKQLSRNGSSDQKAPGRGLLQH